MGMSLVAIVVSIVAFFMTGKIIAGVPGVAGALVAAAALLSAKGKK
jgi:hypothetical protein